MVGGEVLGPFFITDDDIKFLKEENPPEQSRLSNLLIKKKISNLSYFSCGFYNNQGRNQFYQGASHVQNPPPAYQAPAYQAPGYQAPVQQALIPQPQVMNTTEFTKYMKANDAILKNMQTNMTSLTISNLELKNMFGQFIKMNTASSSGSGMLPNNTITNPKEDLKGITTRSGISYKGPIIPTTSSPPKVVERETKVTKDTVPPTNNGSTKDVQPLVVQVETQVPNSEPVVALVVEPVEAPEYSQEVLGFSVSGDPTPSMKPIVSSSSPTLTPFRDIDFLLEETDAFLAIEDEPILPEIDDFVKPKNEKSSIDEPPVVKLKDLPPHIEYVFLEGDDKLPIIIAKDLKDEEKTSLIKVLKSHKQALACPWVSPVHCVPKKGGFTVVENKENKLIPTRLITGLCVCIDYQKLNDVTHKDHFPLPFMDQMLERLARNEYYYFLEGQPMTRLLEKDTPFIFSKECIEAFKSLKKKLTEEPILLAPDWDLPFELICDASDFAIGVTGYDLINVYEGELTLRIGNKAVTFNLDQTSRYSANYDAESINRIDVIDIACEEYSQEVLGFSVSGNPTPFTKPIVSTSFPTLTPFGDSDFLLEETDAFLAI
nr:reverse transcriptase domain-containing protein [Tanacetum cinerariifolium]